MANQTDSDVNELLTRIAKLEALLAQRPHADTSRADIWFLLDRSGSMGAIAEYVVQSFDEFVAEQRNEAGEAAMTLIQFDGEDPQDVLIDAQPLAGIGSIAGRFAPPRHDAAVRRHRHAAGSGRSARRQRGRRPRRSARGDHDRRP
ncbi:MULTISPECIES: hypothetical protein [Mycobacteriaceae]|uniref:Uncharacterized protein n=1 Tax=Mycolicibacterium parafortuitum TaxID=39692 RepID=A0ACC6MBV2_MYCPF|nr:MULTISPECIES: hypothetical protein [Mycobacteriaceae]MDZ5084373.1 hypothetical protein [Mycolicibacterium parafortuitum]GFM17821.1 uncharacterized protein PO1_contig-019-114 [Mycobacterium sp. PO1]GFM24218.1 uncharacterized protein PO2_contig-036-73 [Mycobacterium sp. PO2]